jgi:hypothetical protein
MILPLGLDLAGLKAQQFTAAEACFIVSISPERLHEWHRLDLVPEPREVASRGYRRKYQFEDLAHLMIFRILAKHGILLRKALPLAHLAVFPIVLGTFDGLCGEESIEVGEKKDQFLIAVYSRGEEGSETYDYKWFINGELVEGGSSGLSIESWMTRDTISDVILIRPSQVAWCLLCDMEEVLTGRGTERLREEMELALASVRRPKRKSGGAHRTAASKRRKGAKS